MRFNHPHYLSCRNNSKINRKTNRATGKKPNTNLPNKIVTWITRTVVVMTPAVASLLAIYEQVRDMAGN
jgi:hypothetical protein